MMEMQRREFIKALVASVIVAGAPLPMWRFSDWRRPFLDL